MKIRNQILLNNGMLLTVLLLVAATMYESVSSLVESAEWVNHTQEVISDARLLEKSMVDMETGQRGFMLTGNDEFLEPFIAGQQSFDRTIKATMGLVGDNPAQVERLERLWRLRDEWVKNAGDYEIELRRLVDRGEAPVDALTNVLQGLTQEGNPIPAYRKTGKQRMDEIRGVIDEFVVVEQELLAQRAIETERVARKTENIAVFGSLLATVLAGLVGFFLASKLTHQLGAEPGELRAVAKKVAAGILSEKLVLSGSVESVAVYVNRMIDTFRYAAEKADEVAQGNFDAEISLRSDHDVLGIALKQMTQTLREATQLNEQDSWVKIGQNNLAEAIRGEHELVSLCRCIITQVVQYMGCEVGALYVCGDDGFRLTGSYAFTRRKDLNQTFELGQGLVGQAALEREIIVIGQVPKNYLQISSALGSTGPAQIVVVPLIYDGNVLGVMELGSLKHFDDIGLNLLKLIAPSAAVALHTSMDRTRMTVLLSETQQMAQELEHKQGALKDANQHLEDQANTLKASEEQLLTSNEELREKGAALKQQAANVLRQKTELEEQKEQLAQSSRYKSEFLSNMSHELRTPLNSMLLLSRDLAENESGNLTPEQVEAAQVVHSGGSELLTLINEILDMSKIEAGHMDINLQRIDLEELTEGLRKQFAPLAGEKKIDFSASFGSDAPQFVHSDPQRLRQILKNLLSNAIKFTQDGSVTMVFERADRARPSELVDAEGVVAIRVVDTGIGIPKERWGVVFEAFQQVDGSTSRKYGGTGLGLTISRQLTTLLGGVLELEKSDQTGSTFSLYLPTRASDAQSPAETAIHQTAEQPDPAAESDEVMQTVESGSGSPTVEGLLTLKGRKVLLVDDDTRNLFALSKVLTRAGMRVDCAIDGELAIQKLEASSDVAIVLMDIMMPVMDGLEAITVIRATRRFDALPIIALSAKSVDEHRQQCLDAGADGYLHKPVSKDELLHTIEALLLSGPNRQVLERTA